LNGISILKVSQGGNLSFVYFELTVANRAYWRGNSKEANYEFVVGASPCERTPTQLNAHRNSESVRFSWDRVPGAYGYVVWAKIDNAPWKAIGGAFEPKLEIDLQGHSIEWYVDSHFDQCLKSSSIASVLK
jgi:hypothetical protein